MTDKIPSTPDAPERKLQDRRQDSWRSFLGQFYRRRRHGERRDDVDAAPTYYVDYHEPWLLIMVVLVMILCVADTFNTLTLIEHGGEELNPAMKALMEYNVWVFFLVKYIVTALGLLVLVMHKHFFFLKMFKTKYLVVACFIGYVVLIIYEIILLGRIE